MDLQLRFSKSPLSTSHNLPLSVVILEAPIFRTDFADGLIAHCTGYNTSLFTVHRNLIETRKNR